MLRALLVFVLAGGLLAAACFSVRPARTYRAWWVALFATELGHLWAILAGALMFEAGITAWAADEVMVRTISATAAGGAALAMVGFARPAWCAWRMSGEAEARLRAVFGEGGKLWSWRRLWRWPALAESVPVECYEAEGRAVDFYRAQGVAEAGGAPCVVLVHGGGWDGGDRKELAGLNRWLAARGVAVAAFDYRLAPEFTWPAQAEDLRVVIRWIRANAGRLGVDGERLTLVGRSAGGQIVTATAYGEALPGVRAVVALYGCHDMEFVWSICSAHDALNSHKLMTQFLGGGPDDDAACERYRSASGEKLVHASAPKTLLVHGKLDELVWCRHSERLAAALAKAGVPHVFIELPWATHAGEANLHGPSGQLITGAVLSAARGR